LPKFQVIPINSLIGEKKTVWVEFIQLEQKEQKPKILFSKNLEVDGIMEQSDCCMPIPWPSSDGYIPPENLLKIKFTWLEKGPSVSPGPGSHTKWLIKHCLPLSKLFLPFDISSSPKYGNSGAILAYEEICWKINFPKGVSFDEETYFENFSPKPKTKITPNFHHINKHVPSITFNFSPNHKPFSDIHFSLPVHLSIPIENASETLASALSEIKKYTSDVIVAIVDLRGSSIAAEQERNNPVPIEYTLRFQNLAREFFPHSMFDLYGNDPLGLIMKKTAGDMLILIAPIEKSLNIFKSIVEFTKMLSQYEIPFRAGFHIDQATDTGNKICSLNEFGTDFLGPAINWAAKVGDDKANQGIRITKPVVANLYSYLESRYELEPVEPIKNRPELEIFEITEQRTTKTNQTTQQENFADRVIDRIKSIQSRVCVGLDPDLNKFPISLLKKHGLENFSGTAFDKLPLNSVSECIIEFNKMIIDIVCEDAVAVKPQSAHYERFGYLGIKALYETANYAKSKNLITILDAKRNDIGSTAEKYAYAYLGSRCGKNAAAFYFDAITINAYLGSDGVIPFVKTCIDNGKGIFILVKTSNKSSGDFQDLQLSDEGGPLSRKVAEMVDNYGKDVIGASGYSSIGAVVGATFPDDITELRKQMPKNLFLMPGYGAQGAAPENLNNAFDNDGFGALINSSRAILYPCPPETADFSKFIKDQVVKMKNEINSIITDKQ